MAALEDLGFYCADNLPPQLVAQFVDLCQKADPPIRKIALAMDAREAAFLSAVPTVVDQLRKSGLDVDVMFLDCADDVLRNRYRETRRVHPLSPGGSVEEGIAIERRLLTDVARLADLRLDTTRLNVHQLKDAVAQHVSGLVRATVVSFISFGFRFGTPPSAELLFDVRFLPNPHFEPTLRARTGEDPEVAKYVLENPRAAGSWDGCGACSDSCFRCMTRKEGLPHHRHRLHGRAASLGGHCERTGAGAPRGRPRGKRVPSGRGEVGMKVGVVIVTHYRLGEEFLQALRLIVPDGPRFYAVSIDPKQSVEEMRTAIAEALGAANQGEGVLILTDMFGGTPSNISLSFLKEHRVEVVTGANLPMLIKLATLAEDKSLEDLAPFIKNYGQRNISVASEILPESAR